MGFRINTNIAAMTAHSSALQNNRNLDNSLSKLSSGLRINKAADDASGLAIANALRSQASSLGQAINNGNDAIGLIQTADGALAEYSNILDTIKTKATQAASDGQNSSTRLAIQKDIDKLMEELNTIAKTTSFNGQKLLSGTYTNKEFQMGANANESVKVNIASAETNQIGQTTRADLNLANSQGGEVKLTLTSALDGSQISLRTFNVEFDNTQQNSMGAVADEINRFSGKTGITAKAVVTTTGADEIGAGSTGADFTINGINIGNVEVAQGDNDGTLLNAINSRSTETGVVATKTSDGKLTLTSSDGRAIEVEGASTTVMGGTMDSFTTIGKIELVQAGSSTIRIEGEGVAAVGEDIEIASPATTFVDSTLQAGSIIGSGSLIAEGSVLGGDSKVLVNTADSGAGISDTAAAAGSTIKIGSTLATGTEVGGSFTVGSTTIGTGDTAVGGLNDDGDVGRTALTEDMLVTAGSTLKKGTILGAGTVVTTAFGSFKEGDTLSANTTLTADLTLTADMLINKDSASNSEIAAGSTINKGSVLGADFTVGLITEKAITAGTANNALSVGAAATSDTDIYLSTDENLTLSQTAAGFTFKAGSILADGSEINIIATATAWSGPEMNTVEYGVIKNGDIISAVTGIAAGTSVNFTLDGTNILTADLAVGQSATAGALNISIKAGSILEAGTIATANGGFADVDGRATIDSASADMTIGFDMTLKAGSDIIAGSTLKAGSTLGDATYVYGTGTDNAITTTDITTLKKVSTLEEDSMIAKGSSLGGPIVVLNDETIDDDMIVKAGSTLKADTILKSGTILEQDMILNTAALGGTATEVSLKAGAKLTGDLYVDADTVITNDMVLLKDSVIKAGSTLNTNASSGGSIDIGNEDFSNLSQISVLTLEDAMKAIDTVGAAITNLDTIRSDLGSVQNQVVSTINNISVTQVNVKAAESAIRDVDFAQESANFSKFNILAQSGSYAMSQANAVQQNVMRLLQ